MAAQAQAQYIAMHHQHHPKGHQSSSVIVRHIKAPVDIVWSFVRRFDVPQNYKPFIRECESNEIFKVGSVRHISMRTGLPATSSVEMLSRFDEEEHILGIKIIGGDHRLRNYSSILTMHPEEIDGQDGTMLIESFIVDVPEGNSNDETCCFVRALINCNMKSLMLLSEKMVIRVQEAAAAAAAAAAAGEVVVEDAAAAREVVMEEANGV
ncbi:abscisic acid receptor PYL9-like [Impatiens glandulifera]|uniref:abscisic acid receptor PYL9-like n=1 Tax=Impatiens glandulifera TaxID=253017 RepID=UPI001FB1679D|nr:abscisic acid receptor PYL9-like [Impatiens glandulifera]